MKILPIDLDSEQIRQSGKHPYVVILAMVPDQLQNSIPALQDGLRDVDPKHIYHIPSNLHITVKPLGWLGVDIDNKSLSKILRLARGVVSSFKPFDITLKGLASFPDVA